MLQFQIFITNIAGPEIMFILLVLFSIFLYIKNYKKDFYKILFTSTTAMFGTLILKTLLKIPRPEHMLITETGYGFPSGHATMAGVIMSLGIYYSNTHIKNRYARYFLYIISICWYLIVSYSRLYLQVHHPIDVIAGGIIGILSTIVVFKIFKHLHYYKK
jgi:undecaprenyl-diphosphatase